MPLGCSVGMICPARSMSPRGSNAIAWPSASAIRPLARIPTSAAAASSGQVVSGLKPISPSTAASGVPWPIPVSASEPCSSTVTRAVRSSLPALVSARTNIPPIRIGPTVCEEEGPIPIRKMSSTESMAGEWPSGRGKASGCSRNQPGHKADCPTAPRSVGKIGGKTLEIRGFAPI